jgi:hypothetical protein
MGSHHNGLVLEEEANWQRMPLGAWTIIGSINPLFMTQP